MWLTKNEKKVLKMLLDDAKLSDTSMANSLNISSQAVGRIRRKLEEEIIDGYTLQISFNKVGIGILASCKVKVNEKGMEIGRKEVERKIREEPSILMLCDLMGEEYQYTMLSAFDDLNELKTFFKENEVTKYISCGDMVLSTSDCVFGYYPQDLIKKKIDGFGLKSTKFKLR